MPVQRETKLVNKMRAAIFERWPQAWQLKVHGSAYQRSGIPDLLVVVEGHLIAIEAKAPGRGETDDHARGRVTPLQQLEIEALQRAGATAGVAVTVEEAVALVAAALQVEDNNP